MNATALIHIIEQFNTNALSFEYASLQLIAEGCTAKEAEKLLGKLPETEYYLNRDSGDLYAINWQQNRPDDQETWVNISKACYRVLVGSITHESPTA